MFAALNTVGPLILELATARLLEGDKPWSKERLRVMFGIGFRARQHGPCKPVDMAWREHRRHRLARALPHIALRRQLAGMAVMRWLFYYGSRCSDSSRVMRMSTTPSAYAMIRHDKGCVPIKSGVNR